jgi:hypothetical protein
MPFAAEFHIWAMIFLRFLQVCGFKNELNSFNFSGCRICRLVLFDLIFHFNSADFAAVGILCSNWATLKQNGLFISVLTVYTPLSSAITDSIGGVVRFYHTLLII